MSDTEEWSVLMARLEAMRRTDPKDHGLNQLLLRRETDLLLLMGTADILAGQMRRTHPDASMPLLSWQSHVAYKKMGLGPVPDEAYLHPHGQVPGLVKETYLGRLRTQGQKEAT